MHFFASSFHQKKYFCFKEGNNKNVERWMIIDEFPKYEVSDLGNVRNRRSGRQLRQQQNQSGYVFVILREDGLSYTRTIHKLVAQAFLGNMDDLTPIHNDGDKSNNAAENISWRTRSFAIRKSWQNRRTGPIHTAQVRHIQSGRIFENALEAADEFVFLEEQVIWAAQDPHANSIGNEKFEFVRD